MAFNSLSLLRGAANIAPKIASGIGALGSKIGSTLSYNSGQKMASSGGGGAWGGSTTTQPDSAIATLKASNQTKSKPAPSQVAASSNVPSLRAPAPATPAPTTDGFTSSNPDTQATIQRMLAASGGTPEPNIDMAGTVTPIKPVTPTIPTQTTDPKLEAARQAYLNSLGMSAEEKALNDELAQFRGDATSGINALEGQGRGIPLDLIRGKQAKLGQQAATQEQTLLDRLAAASAARQADAKRAETQLGFVKEDQPTASAPIEIGGSLVQFNPQTGQYETVFSTPEKAAAPVTLSEGQKLIDPNTGQEIAYNPKERAPITVSAGQSVYDPNTGQLLFKAADKPETLPPKIQEYLFAVQNGYTGDPNSFWNQTGNKPTDAAYSAYGFATRMENAASIIDSLDQDFTGVTGQGFSWTPEYLKSEDRKSIEQAERDFINAVLRRESGAAISPSEFDSAAKQYFPQAGDTETILTQKKLNRDTSLNAIKLQAQSVYGQQGGASGGGQNDPLGLGFNSDLGTSQNGSAQAIANAIKQVESGGNYNAKGGSGEGGAYQFMPATWKSWAQQYLGDANAPQTPQNQDAVALAKVQDLLNQGYGAREIALIWNGGQPIVKRGVNQYGVAYDSGAYADKVLNTLG